MKQTEVREEIAQIYLKLVKKNHRRPTSSELQIVGLTKSKVRHHFSNLATLHDYMDSIHGEDVAKNVVNEHVLFTPKKFETLKADIKRYQRFVISTIVSGKEIHTGFLKSIKSYCAKNDATLLLLPCSDVASRRNHTHWNFCPEIENEYIVFNDISLNNNLFLSSIKLSAKHINPLTGLSRIGQRNGSFIYSSPKQFLEFVATTARPHKIPHALMTPGALTLPNYKTDRYMSERTSYLAENDHVMGAVIVELVDDNQFHFRQIQADLKDGSFIDLGIRYQPDGTTKEVISHFVPGDWHCGATDESVKIGIEKLCRDIPITSMILHDFFDGYAINRFDWDQPLKLAKKSTNNLLSLQRELVYGANDLNYLQSLVKGNLVIVKSNHDEFLNRYLESGKYVEDPENHYIALDLARKLLEGEDPLKYAYETYGNLKNPKRNIWLQREDDYRIGGVECGQHGDKGANGSKGSLLSLEKAYGNAVVGHAHSAAILRGIFRVGTSSRLNLDYNTGPSSWTSTGCLVYDNGSRQLINFIGGTYRI